MKIRTRKVFMLSIALLIALAFFSKTIIYWTRPKVTVATVVNGSISYTNQIHQGRIISAGMEKVSTPATLPPGIHVSWAIENKQSAVTRGEALIYVDEASLKSLIAAAEKEYYRSLESITEFKAYYPTAAEDAVKALEAAEKNLKKIPNVNEKRAKQYQHDYEIANDIHHQVITLGLYGSNTLSNLETQRDLVKAELGILQAILDDKCAMRAPCDGFLMAWPEGDTLAQLPAGKTLFEILPAESPWQLEITVEGEVYLQDESESVTLLNLNNPLDRLQFQVQSIKNNDGQTNIVLEGEGIDIDKCKSIDAYALVYESALYEALVPNNAFISDTTVFAVQTVYTDNRIQNKLKEITVKKAPGNAIYTPVKSGVTSGMQLVTSWDRSISDGDIVIIGGDME